MKRLNWVETKSTDFIEHKYRLPRVSKIISMFSPKPNDLERTSKNARLKSDHNEESYDL